MKPLSPKDWLFSGGGGFEDNDLAGHSFTAYGLVDMLESYKEYLEEFYGVDSDAPEPRK